MCEFEIGHVQISFDQGDLRLVSVYRNVVEGIHVPIKAMKYLAALQCNYIKAPPKGML